MNILIVESSTTSAKAMIYHSKYGVQNVKTKAFYSTCKNPMLQEAEEVFLQTTALARELSEGVDIDLIVLSGTYHSVMLCDSKEYKPVTPVYQWNYTGAANLCEEKRKDCTYTKKYYETTGCMVNAIYPSFKLELLRSQGWKLENYFIMGQGTYNYYRLTGKRAVMESMASGSGLLNIHTKQYEPEILKELGISENQLSELVSYKEVYPLDKEGAKILGLKEGIPVMAAGPDGGLNQVGSQALEKGVMTFSVGTSGAMRFTAELPKISENESTWCYLSPYSWMSGAAVSGCCNCVDWARKTLFPRQLSYADIEKNFSSEIQKLPIFLPFLFGERCPGWRDERKGGFQEIKPEHTAYDFYQGVLQGILFNLYQSFLELVKINGEPKRIKLSGGILNSKYWTQMCADIFGYEMELDEAEHSSMLGGAILGLDYLGCIESIGQFEIIPGKRIIPDKSKWDIYQENYKKYLNYY